MKTNEACLIARQIKAAVVFLTAAAVFSKEVFRQVFLFSEM
jgi:hypothetical protein